MLSFKHEQNIICSQTQLDNIAHEQTIIRRQLFAGHVVGSRPMKKKKTFATNDKIICKIGRRYGEGKEVHMAYTYL